MADTIKKTDSRAKENLPSNKVVHNSTKMRGRNILLLGRPVEIVTKGCEELCYRDAGVGIDAYVDYMILHKIYPPPGCIFVFTCHFREARSGMKTRYHFYGIMGKFLKKKVVFTYVDLGYILKPSAKTRNKICRESGEEVDMKEINNKLGGNVEKSEEDNKQ